MTSDRLSDEQRSRAQQKALQFRQRVEQQGEGKGFSEVFRLAALKIEADVDRFCDRAAAVFDEIEAYGQEPQLDDDWLGELTGHNDTFYFSTDSFVSEPQMLPSNRGHGRKAKVPDEQAVVQAVEAAVQTLEDALAVSHSENVQDWIQRIAIALRQQSQSTQESGERTIDFWLLQNITGLSPSALWLGLLLGHQHWTVKQTHFYGDVSVGLHKEKTGAGASQSFGS